MFLLYLMPSQLGLLFGLNLHASVVDCQNFNLFVYDLSYSMADHIILAGSKILHEQPHPLPLVSFGGEEIEVLAFLYPSFPDGHRWFLLRLL